MLFMVTDYWFESLSILIVFELMMYLDIAVPHREVSGQNPQL